jgi:hypothetical protein
MLRTILCVALALLLTSCVPIGARVQNMYAAQTPPTTG